MYGYCTASSNRRLLFHKTKKENRIMYYMDDNLIPIDELMNSQIEIPLDISIRGKSSKYLHKELVDLFV
jgi:hypothetical protein